MNVLEHQPDSDRYCSPSGQIEDACCLYETIEEATDGVFRPLDHLVKTPFFRYFKVDLFEECPFWYEDTFCMNRDCGVETEEDESKIPEKWRAQALSSLNDVQEPNDSSHPACFATVSDFCYTPDEASPTGVYVDLSRNPERFTGYSGPSAQRVWDTIYKENCFGVADFFEASGRVHSGVADVTQVPPSMGLLMGAGGPLGAGQPGLEPDFDIDVDGENDMCVEKRVYYKLISGLHSSISMHICSEWLNQETGEWGPNLDCFINKLSQYPERIQNIYFLHAVLTRAIARARPLLERYDTSVGDASADALTRQYMRDIMDQVNSCGDTFQEGTIFEGGRTKQILKEEFKAHFRNVSRIMDCVGCDKCRLWGKVQVSGIGTALKILFGLDSDDFKQPNTLQRSEVVALFNTFHRISESINNIEVFRELYDKSKTKVEIIADPVKVALDYKHVDYTSTLINVAASEPFVAGDAEHKYNEGDIVLGKIKGYPAWPGKIVKADNVPPRVQKDKPKKKKDVYAIRFYPTGEYMWASTKEMSMLTKDEISKYLDDSSKKRDGDLRKGYQVAMDPADWEEEYDRRLAELQAQEDAEEEVDDEDAGNKRRRKTTKGSIAKKAKTDDADKKKALKVDNSMIAEEEDEPTRVKSWRHELQRIFLSPEPAKAESMQKADAQYKLIEAAGDISVEAIQSSKLNKVLKRIIGLENIPEDDKYKIRERSQTLFDRFEKILAANGEKGETTGEKEAEKKEENGEKKEENGEHEEKEEKKEENGEKVENVEEKNEDAEKKPEEENTEDKEDKTADASAEQAGGEEDKKEAEKPAEEAENAENAEKPAEDGSAAPQ
ncbi:hypothetical protein E3P99_03297 [Wallemia hederae]|uniref:PWWP domain-containing protein n=1 Tax=Wallemia hederae TaxID=1540922 RepID=A0A4V4LSS2_9BASI|nr:hypothetical protein E3P99_03297 [Wallemia hederae]